MPKPDETKLTEARDALGYDVRDACEGPLNRIDQATKTLFILSERLFRGDEFAAEAVSFVQVSLEREAEALRKTLRLHQGGVR